MTSRNEDVPKRAELAERIIEAFEEQFGVAQLDDDQFSLAMLATDEAWMYFRDYEINGDDSEPDLECTDF